MILFPCEPVWWKKWNFVTLFKLITSGIPWLNRGTLTWTMIYDTWGCSDVYSPIWQMFLLIYIFFLAASDSVAFLVIHFLCRPMRSYLTCTESAQNIFLFLETWFHIKFKIDKIPFNYQGNIVFNIVLRWYSSVTSISAWRKNNCVLIFFYKIFPFNSLLFDCLVKKAHSDM